MNKYLQKLYYTDIYKENSKGWAPVEDNAKTRTVLNILDEANIRSSIRTILDVGCGTGEVISNLKNEIGGDISALGIDLSPTSISIAQAKKRKGLRYECVDLNAIEDKYDFIILSHVIEHVMDWDEFLESVALRSCGYIYINVPLDVNVVSVLRGNSLLDTYRKYGHVHFFDENYFIQYLKDSGFDIIKTNYGEEFMVQTATTRGKLAKIPRRILGFFSKKLAARILGGYSLVVLCKVSE